MNSKNNNAIISKASPHTIKKFKLIEKYVQSWSQKLLNNPFCDTLVFIDCMCNSGEYYDDNNNVIYGTPVRVSKILREAAGQYYQKNIHLYFNDYKEEKTSHLKNLISKDYRNFKTHISSIDGNALLKKIASNLSKTSRTHYLLVYDPYDASIDWSAIVPFLNNWGEVIINHMVSDSVRALKTAKSQSAIDKYEKTYMSKIEHLIPYGSNKTAYEQRVEHIIQGLRQNTDRKYYIAAFPFFIRTNTVEYNLIHCTSHIKGFKLYKEIAWKTFEGKSSTKNMHGHENQFVLDFDNLSAVSIQTDKDCYTIHNIAEYIQKTFSGQQDVPLSKIWEVLDEHPIFPSDGFRKEIKSILKQYYNVIEKNNKMTFHDRSNL